MVRCPLINEDINEAECVSITSVANGCIKEDVLNKEITKQKDWKETCSKCKYHNM